MATRRKRARKQNRRKRRRERALRINNSATGESNARPGSADHPETARTGQADSMKQHTPSQSDPEVWRPAQADWAGPDGEIGCYIRAESEKSLESYRIQPNLVAEHANAEDDTARGGYSNRQLFELVQNSADALAESDGERILVRLTPTHLYCADNGKPINIDGVRALLFSHLSAKPAKQSNAVIGQFGLGFKSVLAVTDSPEFFSQSGSFRFDRSKSAKLLQPIAPGRGSYPVLRLAEPIDSSSEIKADRDLHEMAGWATNIVRLPLKLNAAQVLDKQIAEFPAEFMLFVNHVGRIALETLTPDTTRVIELADQGKWWELDNNGNTTRWMIVNGMHKLSREAKADTRGRDNADDVPIWWAAPIDQLNDPGRYWAFFPTLTPSRLAGILNAPWKTNEDRQNLLPGAYNDELIDAAAVMIAQALPILATTDDPAKHLDALPRREDASGSEHSNRLRNCLYDVLTSRNIVPDQDGNLRKPSELKCPPNALVHNSQASGALKEWSTFEHRPKDWIHNSALTRNRLARIHWLVERSPTAKSWHDNASIAEWMEALTKTAEHQVQASKAAISIAVKIPVDIRHRNDLGQFVLTAAGNWVGLDPKNIFLDIDHVSTSDEVIHHCLQSDTKTLDELKKLGVKPASAESVFRNVSSELLDGRRYFHPLDEGPVPLQYVHRLGGGPVQRDDSLKPKDSEWREFWNLARNLDPHTAAKIIQDQVIPSERKQWSCWRDTLHVRTVDGNWRPFGGAFLPGDIVPKDGSRDAGVTVDTEFHECDLPLLEELGVVGAPENRQYLSLAILYFFTQKCRKKFTHPERALPNNPHWWMLDFEATTTSGPLAVLSMLSEEGKALYTWDLLSLDDTYQRWTMRHDTQSKYPPMECEPPAIYLLREFGRIKANGEIHRLSDGLGESPKNPAVLRKLLSHPKAASIRRAFEIHAETDLLVEPFGEDDPIPLADEWPGLRPHLSERQTNFELVRCDGLRVLGSEQGEAEWDCVIKEDLVYITRKDSEAELQTLLRELGLQLSQDKVKLILLGLTDADVQDARKAVRGHETDAERLHAAVGKAELRRHLPSMLIEILEDDNNGHLTGVQLAQAAIATFHTGALREYRHALQHLAPPKKWAGTRAAVAFVQQLGFAEEWAMEQRTRRDPYVEVEGPYSLPPLHKYQRKIVDRVRRLIRSNGTLQDRRGMVSLPTGSGKTRVAVQAIVEALREDELAGGVLWIADRDELCEQAVVAWRQAWASEGKQSAQLRISRMWEGQPSPPPSGNMHVIVASIQTLFSRISRQTDDYRFLTDFSLVVFDEAHRSVAPTFVGVMRKLGMHRKQRGANEPFLIGLTATPYRGYDEDATRHLVDRYGENRLDAGAFKCDDAESVIGELQDMRVLARADQATIEGSSVSLSGDELRQARAFPWLPESAEQRIAEDKERTRRIVRQYINCIDPDWPTLIFATSVEHSKVLAALLEKEGIRSRSVDGKTDRIVRRHVVDEFRSRRIQALVNYNVFREGFDAPRTRAIIVARPVYSPNLYFQMIGRGLRGVINGGNDRCLILNVEDNIENFEGRLAFSELDWLWDRG